MGIKPGERVIDREAFDDVSYHDTADDSSGSLRPGDRIRHKKFGNGVVERVEHDGEVTVVARFPGYGMRRLRWSRWAASTSQCTAR